MRCDYIHHCDVCRRAGANAKSNAHQSRYAAAGPANDTADSAAGNASNYADYATDANHAGDPGTKFPGDQTAAFAAVTGSDAGRRPEQQRCAAVTNRCNSQSIAEQ